MNKLIERVIAAFPNVPMTVEQAGTGPAVVVESRRVKDVLRFLKDDKESAFDMLTDLFGIDRYPLEPRFEIVYLLNSIPGKVRLTVKARIGDREEIETVSDLWRGADWLEREVFDMLGVSFRNHPDLRRILMVEDFDGYPLRKDYPTEGYGFDEPVVIQLEEEKA